ncbi:glycerol-3-phosphate dehydrogenase/oxidase [Marinovum sp.]|uniref:glycerol-3-phosphate dehydrogenase/oxidase n=1 Tax=Marinovum sp. TaxID=2024839 RepID=UPI003A8CEF32
MTEPLDIDVLIIGGGINGCGTFRDLSAQGIDCLLIEREDFCAGASAASSRLMHGGLKYLETGEFGLVRESLTERNRLLQNAPHFVTPLPTILPLRSRFAGILPSVRRFFGLKAKLTNRGSLITRAGLMLYDLYGRRHRSMPRHRLLGRKALEDRVAGMDPKIVAAGLYYEGQLSHAERLGLELVQDAERLNPRSRAVNHARIVAVEGACVTYEAGGRRQTVRPRIVVNAGGAWIDAVNRDLGIESRLMGGSKGSHVIVDHPGLYRALNGHMIYFGTADGRVNLCYPFMDRVLIGSTDIPVEDPDTAFCEDTEVAYMLAAVGEVFPDIALTEEHVRYRFCGVRPLPRADGEIGLVTRDHSIAEVTLGAGTPVLCLIGGKWTTFRAFSAEAARRVLDHLGQPHRVDTGDMAIGGGAGFPRTPAARDGWVDRVAQASGLSAERVAGLLDRYGTTGERIAEACAGETMLAAVPDYSDRELAFLCRNERVETLADLLLRRTLIAMSGRLTPQAIEECARVAGTALGWSEDRRQREVSALCCDDLTLVRRNMAAAPAA